jgi:hypothetical protein
VHRLGRVVAVHVDRDAAAGRDGVAEDARVGVLALLGDAGQLVGAGVAVDRDLGLDQAQRHEQVEHLLVE